jgi:hypothetical protein
MPIFEPGSQKQMIDVLANSAMPPLYNYSEHCINMNHMNTLIPEIIECFIKYM